MNIIGDRKIGLFLFIDFRKAFDLVDSNILFKKLSRYGFEDKSIDLIKNNFEDRSQIVVVNGIKSSQKQIKLGVPQGSVLGPLFFLLFINDLPYYLKLFDCTLFADDTTLSLTNNSLKKLLSDFIIAGQFLISLCRHNKLDINWKKTQIMFISKKKGIELPRSIVIDGAEIQVVSSFKLLGITLDDKLNFVKHVSDIRLAINRNFFALKRLSYLPFKVKLQFSK